MTFLFDPQHIDYFFGAPDSKITFRRVGRAPAVEQFTQRVFGLTSRLFFPLHFKMLTELRHLLVPASIAAHMQVDLYSLCRGLVFHCAGGEGGHQRPPEGVHRLARDFFAFEDGFEAELKGAVSAAGSPGGSAAYSNEELVAAAARVASSRRSAVSRCVAEALRLRVQSIDVRIAADHLELPLALKLGDGTAVVSSVAGLAFGGGPYRCPGRFFAEQELGLLPQLRQVAGGSWLYGVLSGLVGARALAWGCGWFDGVDGPLEDFRHSGDPGGLLPPCDLKRLVGVKVPRRPLWVQLGVPHWQARRLGLVGVAPAATSRRWADIGLG
eukprot:XP_001703655.1 predicted protein [Chlamydomonas reinhardtii]